MWLKDWEVRLLIVDEGLDTTEEKMVEDYLSISKTPGLDFAFRPWLLLPLLPLSTSEQVQYLFVWSYRRLPSAI